MNSAVFYMVFSSDKICYTLPMKRLLSIFMPIILLAGVLTGCGGRVDPGQKDPSPSPAPASATAAAAVEIIGLAVEDTPSPTAVPTPAPTPEPASFSVVWISDTQFISSLYPDTLKRMMQWAADNAEENNIQLLVHTGDIVNDFESTRQWTDAASAFSLLSGKLPFLAVCGNHDVGTSTVTYTRFGKYIASQYVSPERLYREGRGYFVPVEEQGQKLLFIGIGWGYNDAAVAWLNETLAKYPDYTAVLCLHSYMDPNGRLTDGGEIIWENVIKKNANVRLVLCGHRDGAAYQKTELNGRAVHQLMYNYQEERKNEGGGFLRVLRFYPSVNGLDIATYSPHLDAYMTDDKADFFIADVF